MKAMSFSAPALVERRPLQLTEFPVPGPGPGQVLVRVTACGVCRTDLHIIEGELPPRKSPLVPGHQVVGIVEKLGPEVEGFEIGARVGVPWMHRTCGRCAFCQRGRENLCESALFNGYNVNGGYADYILSHESFTFPIPDAFPDLQAAPLLCAGVIGYRALRLTDVPPNGRLGLYGFGGSAHVVIQIAVRMGLEVYVFSRSEEHGALARDLGAAWVGSAKEGPPQKLDGSIIFAPAGELVPLALEHLTKGGVLSLAGIYMTQVPGLDYTRHLYDEKVIRSVANSTRQDVKELLTLAAEVPVRTRVQPFPLESANDALIDLKQGQINGAAALTLT